MYSAACLLPPHALPFLGWPPYVSVGAPVLRLCLPLPADAAAGVHRCALLLWATLRVALFTGYLDALYSALRRVLLSDALVAALRRRCLFSGFSRRGNAAPLFSQPPHHRQARRRWRCSGTWRRFLRCRVRVAGAAYVCWQLRDIPCVPLGLGAEDHAACLGLVTILPRHMAARDAAALPPLLGGIAHLW